MRAWFWGLALLAISFSTIILADGGRPARSDGWRLSRFSTWQPGDERTGRRSSRKFYWRDGDGILEGECPPNLSHEQAARASCARNVTAIPQADFLAGWLELTRAGIEPYDREHGVGTVDPEQLARYQSEYDSLADAELTMFRTGESEVTVDGQRIPASDISARLWQVGRRVALARRWLQVTAEFLEVADGQATRPAGFATTGYADRLPEVFHRFRRSEREKGRFWGRVATVRRLAASGSGFVDRNTGNQWKLLSDEPGTIQTSTYEWLTFSEARDGLPTSPSEAGEVGCGDVFGQGWHVPTYDDLAGARDRLAASPLGDLLEDGLIWTSSFAGHGWLVVESYSAGRSLDYYWVVRLRNSWGEWTYTQQSNQPASTAPALCVCGPSVATDGLRTSPASCRAAAAP